MIGILTSEFGSGGYLRQRKGRCDGTQQGCRSQLPATKKLDLTSHLTSHIMVFLEWFMTKWQLQEAKARFSELIDDTLEKGPQVVTRRGIDTAVVVSIDEWHKLRERNRLTWKDVLLGEGPRFDIPLPKRGTVKLRKPPVFD